MDSSHHIREQGELQNTPNARTPVSELDSLKLKLEQLEDTVKALARRNDDLESQLVDLGNELVAERRARREFEQADKTRLREVTGRLLHLERRQVHPSLHDAIAEHQRYRKAPPADEEYRPRPSSYIAKATEPRPSNTTVGSGLRPRASYEQLPSLHDALVPEHQRYR
jgi:hypothetical protein